jgi:hypothetical protein
MRVFLRGDAVGTAIGGQQLPYGYHHARSGGHQR